MALRSVFEIARQALLLTVVLPAAAAVPEIVRQPESVAETIGGAAAFVVEAEGTGSEPLHFQWFHQGVAMVGETRAELSRAPLATVHAGIYSVRVSNSSGHVDSTGATLTLLSEPPSPLDLHFRAAPVLRGAPSVMLPLPGGGLIVADSETNAVYKLQADGTPDPSWTNPVFSGPLGARITALAPAPDGDILVGGFFAAGARTVGPIARLQPDGRIDDSFSTSIPEALRFIQALVVQPDGKVLLAPSDPQGGPILVRLLPNGSIDPDFHAPVLEPIRVWTGDNHWHVHALDVGSDGSILAAAQVRITDVVGSDTRRVQLMRFSSSGALDPAFAPAPWEVLRTRVVIPGTPIFTRLRALANGSVVVVATGSSGSPGQIRRFTANGAEDPAHAQPVIPAPAVAAISPEGGVYFSEHATNRLRSVTPAGVVENEKFAGVESISALGPAMDGGVFVGGAFAFYAGVESFRVAKVRPVADTAPNAPRILRLTTNPMRASYGELIEVRAAVVGSAPLTYEWQVLPFSNGPVVTSVPEFRFVQEHAVFDSRTFVILTVRNSRGAAASEPVAISLVPAAPRVTEQPTRISTQAGRDIFLKTNFNDTAYPVVAEWRKEGQLLVRAGAVGDAWGLRIPAATPADAGEYTLVLRNSEGAVGFSQPIRVEIDARGRPVNLSTRAVLRADGSPLIAGFVIEGAKPKQVLMRAVGPSLARFGIPDAMPDPQFTVYDHSGRIVLTADDWSSDSARQARVVTTGTAVRAFPLVFLGKDAAETVALEPGAYTISASGKPGESGTVLVEVYEADNDAAEMVNLSSRIEIRPGEPAIAGFVVEGTRGASFVLRVCGPALAAYGVPSPLRDPRCVVRDAEGRVVAENDNWTDGATSGSGISLSERMQQLGAFPLRPGDGDAAMEASLPPGNYTIVAEGAAGQSGTALIEIYRLP